MTTVWSGSISRRRRISATKARRSAASVCSPNGESTARARPSRPIMRGKRRVSRFTHSGA